MSAARGFAWWRWPTVLALDAPAVALLWQEGLAELAGVDLDIRHRAGLAVAVWLAYAADRWLEAVRQPETALVTARHRFAYRHRRLLLVAWCVVLGGMFAWAARTFESAEWWASLLLAGAAGSYVLAHSRRSNDVAVGLPKEAFVALLLPAGAGLYPAMLSARVTAGLCFGMALFTGLAFLNCVLIGIWELEADRVRSQRSVARDHPAWLARMDWWPLGLAAVGSAGLLAGGAAVRALGVSAASAALLLAVLHRSHALLPDGAARLLADLAVALPPALIVLS